MSTELLTGQGKPESLEGVMKLRYYEGSQEEIDYTVKKTWGMVFTAPSCSRQYR